MKTKLSQLVVDNEQLLPTLIVTVATLDTVPAFYNQPHQRIVDTAAFSPLHHLMSPLQFVCN